MASLLSTAGGSLVFGEQVIQAEEQPSLDRTEQTKEDVGASPLIAETIELVEGAPSQPEIAITQPELTYTGEGADQAESVPTPQASSQLALPTEGATSTLVAESGSEAVNQVDTKFQETNSESSAVANNRVGGQLVAEALPQPEDIEEPEQVTYQWYADGAPITGAVQSTYRVRPTDVGKTIHAEATSLDKEGKSNPLTLEETSQVITDNPAYLSELGHKLYQHVQYGKCIDAADFGVRADKEDNSQELKAALKAADAEAAALYLGEGTFKLREQLRIGKPIKLADGTLKEEGYENLVGLFGAGQGKTVLTFDWQQEGEFNPDTNLENINKWAAILIDGVHDKHIADLSLKYEPRTEADFYRANKSYFGKINGIIVNDADRTTIDNIEVSGVNRAGVFFTSTATTDSSKGQSLRDRLINGKISETEVPVGEGNRLINSYLHHNRVAGALFAYQKDFLADGNLLVRNGHEADGGTGYGIASMAGSYNFGVTYSHNQTDHNYRKGLDIHDGNHILIENNKSNGDRVHGIAVYNRQFSTTHVRINNNTIVADPSFRLEVDDSPKDSYHGYAAIQLQTNTQHMYQNLRTQGPGQFEIMGNKISGLEVYQNAMHTYGIEFRNHEPEIDYSLDISYNTISGDSTKYLIGLLNQTVHKGGQVGKGSGTITIVGNQMDIAKTLPGGIPVYIEEKMTDGNLRGHVAFTDNDLRIREASDGAVEVMQMVGNAKTYEVTRNRLEVHGTINHALISIRGRSVGEKPDLAVVNNEVITDTKLLSKNWVEVGTKNGANASVTVLSNNHNGQTAPEKQAIYVANQAPTDLLLNNTSLNEDQLGAIVGQLTVEDGNPDDSHTYTIDYGRFEVLNHQLKLKDDQKLSYQEGADIPIQIKVTDKEGLSLTKDFRLTLIPKLKEELLPEIPKDREGEAVQPTGAVQDNGPEAGITLDTTKPQDPIQQDQPTVGQAGPIGDAGAGEVLAEEQATGAPAKDQVALADPKGEATPSLVGVTEVPSTDSQGTAAKVYTKKKAGLNLDIARHFYSTETIKKFIDHLAEQGGDFLHLHLSDNENYALESHVLDQRVDKALLTETGSYINPKTGKSFLSFAQLTDLAGYAKTKGIDLIPEIGSPAHMNGIFTLLGHQNPSLLKTIQASWSSQPQLDITKPESLVFIQSLLDEVLPLETDASSAIHLGGDEFNYPPQYNHEFITYVNRLSTYLADKGYGSQLYNDGILKADLANLDKSIEITYWSYDGAIGSYDSADRAQLRDLRPTMMDFLATGFDVLNYNGYYLYSIPTVGQAQDSSQPSWLSSEPSDYSAREILKTWTLGHWNDQNQNNVIQDTRSIKGAALSIWGEEAGHLDGDTIQRYTKNKLAALILKTKAAGDAQAQQQVNHLTQNDFANLVQDSYLDMAQLSEKSSRGQINLYGGGKQRLSLLNEDILLAGPAIDVTVSGSNLDEIILGQHWTKGDSKTENGHDYEAYRLKDHVLWIDRDLAIIINSSTEPVQPEIPGAPIGTVTPAPTPEVAPGLPEETPTSDPTQPDVPTPPVTPVVEVAPGTPLPPVVEAAPEGPNQQLEQDLNPSLGQVDIQLGNPSSGVGQTSSVPTNIFANQTSVVRVSVSSLTGTNPDLASSSMGQISPQSTASLPFVASPNFVHPGNQSLVGNPNSSLPQTGDKRFSFLPLASMTSLLFAGLLHSRSKREED